MPRLNLDITPADHQKLSAAAAKAKLTISAWVRRLLKLEPAAPQGRRAK